MQAKFWRAHVLFALATGLLAQPAFAEFDSVLRGTLQSEYDSNARRVPDNQLVKGDGLLRAQADAQTRSPLASGIFSATGALGGKLFLTTATENMLVGQGQAALSFPVRERFSFNLSAFAKGRGQRSGVRTYLLSRSQVQMGFRPNAFWRFRGGAVGGTFQPADASLFTNVSAGLFLAGTRFFGAREVVDVELHTGVRAFPRLAPALLDGAGNGPRLDFPLRARFQFRSSRELFTLARYELMRTYSNSRGAAFTRHRFFAQVGFRLPQKLTASARVNAQLTRYDDGISVGQEIFLRVDDESQNAFAVSLSRPLFSSVSIEARGAYYANEIAADGLDFLRTTASLGLSGEWD